MKNWQAFWVSLLVSANVLSGTGYAEPIHGEIPASLDSFYITEDGRWQYENLSWGNVEDETLDQLPYKMTKQEIDLEMNPNATGYAFYTAEEVFSLEGQRAQLRIEFDGGRLTEVRFNFHLDDSYEEWYTTVTEELAQRYGEPDEIYENTFESQEMESWGCRWDRKDTTMQLNMMAGESIHPSAVLGIAQIPQMQAGEAIPVPLNQLRTKEGVYQFASCDWGISVEQVFETLPYTMEELLMSEDGNPEGLDYYIAQDTFSLDGQPAEFRLEFSKGKLREVRFTFELDESYEKWYDTQVQELTKLYGKPDRQTVTTQDAMGTTNWNCAWDTEETSLQFFLLTQASKEATAILGVAKIVR